MFHLGPRIWSRWSHIRPALVPAIGFVISHDWFPYETKSIGTDWRVVPGWYSIAPLYHLFLARSKLDLDNPVKKVAALIRRSKWSLHPTILFMVSRHTIKQFRLMLDGFIIVQSLNAFNSWNMFFKLFPPLLQLL